MISFCQSTYQLKQQKHFTGNAHIKQCLFYWPSGYLHAIYSRNTRDKYTNKHICSTVDESRWSVEWSQR